MGKCVVVGERAVGKGKGEPEQAQQRCTGKGCVRAKWYEQRKGRWWQARIRTKPCGGGGKGGIKGQMRVCV